MTFAPPFGQPTHRRGSATRLLASNSQGCNDLIFEMPTPAGHAAAGLIVAWFAESTVRKPSFAGPLAIGCALAATIADIDILFGSHRTYTHSITAAAIAGIATWMILWRRTPLAARLGLAVAAAYASHPLLDWLGKDTSVPPGVMACCPWSSRYFISGLDLFGEVSRRYWKPDEFIVGNFNAVGHELLILAPVAIVAWLLRSPRSTDN